MLLEGFQDLEDYEKGDCAMLLSLIAFEQQDFEAALSLSAEATKTSYLLPAEHGREVNTVSLAVRARALLALDRTHEALDACRQAEQALTSSSLQKHQEHEPFVQAAIAEVQLVTGRPDEAMHRIRRAADALKRRAESFDDPEFSQNFLNSAPEYRRILELAAQANVEPG